MMKAFESFLTLPEQDKRDVFEAAASRLDTLPSGEVTKKDLDKARKAAREIDVNNIKAIVSVMMLREGLGCAQRDCGARPAAPHRSISAQSDWTGIAGSVSLHVTP